MLNTINRRMQLVQITLILLFCVALTMLSVILYVHRQDIKNRAHTAEVEVTCQRCGRVVPVCLPTVAPGDR